MSKLLKKAKKAGRKLMRKLGIGKGDKKKKQKGDKDERTPAEMQADLKKGIQEATMFVKGGETDKKKIKKKFDKIEKKYDLVELKLVVDKLNPEGKDKAHVHGEVNPVIDGDSFEIELDESGNELAPGAENKALGIVKSPEVTDRNGTVRGSGTKLGKSLGSSSLPSIGAQGDYAAHHIIATSSGQKSTFVKAGAQSGYNINRATNGVWLPRTEAIAILVNLPLHSGGHITKYFNTVDSNLKIQENKAKKAKQQGKPWKEIQVLNALETVESRLRVDLINLSHPMKLQHNDPLKPVDPNPENPTF